jgi:hypothetical protein
VTVFDPVDRRYNPGSDGVKSGPAQMGDSRMKMCATLLLALGVGLAAGLAFGQTSHEQSFPGVVVSHRNLERFDMSVGITGNRNPARPTRLYTSRFQMNVPAFYGRILGMTGDARRTILWYVSEDETIRNVVLDTPGETLYSIVPMPVGDLEIEPTRR